MSSDSDGRIGAPSAPAADDRGRGRERSSSPAISIEHRRTSSPQRRRGRFDRGALSSEPFAYVIAAELVVLSVIGGGPSTYLTAIPIAIVAGVLLVWLAASPRARAQIVATARLTRAAIAGVALIPAVQLVPLPPVVWQALPDGALRRTTLALVGAADSWQPLSVTPADTAVAALTAFGFAVLLVSLLACSPRALRAMVRVALALVGIDVAIGVCQVTSGGSPHLLRQAHDGDLIGFFANKNHAAATLAATLPFIHLLIAARARTRQTRLRLFAPAALLVLVSIIATNSRAGLIFGLILTGLLMVPLVAPRVTVRSAAMAAVVVALLMAIALSPAANQLVHRFDEVDRDTRWAIARQSVPLLRTWGLTGAGIGSYARVFIVGEHLDWLTPFYTNAAHDDYLQLVIEAGVPGLIALAVFVAALATAVVRHGREQGWAVSFSHPFWSGLMVVMLFAAHSCVDYPLRRGASWPLFAIACVLVMRPSSGAALTSAALPERRRLGY